MSSDDNVRPGVVGVATGGIQDVSALLPLLGTEQCERLVTSALQRGLLYAAAAPMSIFGSLGVVKAGFVVLWASIDHRFFPGPTLLRNAGFIPAGLGELLDHVAESNRHLYVAEDKIRRHLSKIRIRSVRVNLLSKDLWFWNLRLIGITALFSSFGLLPYVYLIVRFLSDDPFQTTWLYPVIRIVGCDMVAISIQFVFQLRVLEEAYCRIRFLATDSYLKDHGRSVPEFWDPNERSKDVLGQLRYLPVAEASRAVQPPAMTVRPRRGRRRASAPMRSMSIDNATKNPIVEGLGQITSFSFPVFEEETRPSSPPLALPLPTFPLTPSIPTTGLTPIPANPLPPISANPTTAIPTMPLTNSSQQAPGDPNAAERGEADESRLHGRVAQLFSRLSRPDHYFTSLLLCMTQASLLLGLGLSVVGYIGCFSVVQASPRGSSRGPLIWLICEALLAIVRTLVWAWNPKWDDPKSPIALEKIALSRDGMVDLAKTKKSSYGIGWMLDSVTANDMHALIVGIDEFRGFETLTQCVADAREVAHYLQDTLLVPRSQIVTLINSEATKERIVEELKALAHRASVIDGAPIVIYFATHSYVDSFYRDDSPSTYLIPYVDAVDFDDFLSGDSDNMAVEFNRHALAYSTIVDILKHVSEEKSDNITLILDSCNAGTMGVNKKFLTSQYGPLRTTTAEILVGHPSHILLAAAGTQEQAYEDIGNGGLFTRTLLEILGEELDLGELGKVTYKRLVEKINERIKKKRPDVAPYQTALCTTIYQNRLLFNGLFSRKLNEDSSMPVITVLYSDL